jgi:hypothetical protein
MTNPMHEHTTASHAPPRLSGADRAFMLAVAERELLQGKIIREEYDYIQELCRAHPGVALRNLLHRVTRGRVARA